MANIFFRSDFYRQADQLHLELSQLYQKYPELNPKLFGIFRSFRALTEAAGKAAIAMYGFSQELKRLGMK